MKIYDNLLEISNRFDTFLVDAYGVFWDGKGLISGSTETLSALVSQGKQVCILSNTSAINYSYASKGLTQGVHYTRVITSGDVFFDALCRGDLPFSGNRFYIIGVSQIDIAAIPPFRIVNTLSDADMVYFGTPQLTGAEVAQYPDLAQHFYKNKDVYNSTIIQPFLPWIDRVYRSGLPVLSTNPDLIASEGGHWVIRQGTLAQLFRDRGGRIIEYGKPYSNIYRYAFQKLGITPTSRIAMIGDTYRTDIQGALNAGITPIWCTDTGIARYEVEQGNSLLSQAGGSLDGIILIRHL